MAITWLGHGSFQIETPAGAVLLVDPWSSGPTWPKAHAIERCDAILVTHGHGDHAQDVPAFAAALKAPVLALVELADWLVAQGVANTIGFNKGGTTEIAGCLVTMTNAVHSSSAPDDTPIGDPSGFVIECEGMPTIYLTGDTAVHADMGLIGEIYRPQIVVLPIGDFYTMGPRQAAHAVRLVGASDVVCGHYGTFPALTGTPSALRDELAKLKLNATVHEAEPGACVLEFA